MPKHTHPLKPHKHANYDTQIKALQKEIKNLATRLRKVEHKLNTHSH